MNDFEATIISNLRKILNDRGLKQAVLADYASMDTSQVSKVMNGTVHLSLVQLSNIATKLGMREIDIITYPEEYISPSKSGDNDEGVEAVLQIKLNNKKKHQVLNLVFGENDIEILNK